MNHSRHILYLILDVGFTLFALVAMIFAIWVYSIYYSVKNAPKEDMFYCPKHGPMRKQDCIKFMDSVEIVDVEDNRGTPIKSHISHGESYCPLCFHERLGGSLPS